MAHQLPKPLSMIYLALWDRSHEVATSALTYSGGPLMHSAQYIMLNSYYGINYLVSAYCEAEIWKRSSEARGDEPCIVEKSSLHGFVGHLQHLCDVILISVSLNQHK